MASWYKPEIGETQTGCLLWNKAAYTEERGNVTGGDDMRRLCGYTLFCIAVGMLIGLFIQSVLMQAILILGLLLLGYNLFVCG